MSETNSVDRLSRTVRAPGTAAMPPACQRPGVRVVLLSLAAAILLLGAVLAVVFCCRAVSAGGSASAVPPADHLASAGAAR